MVPIADRADYLDEQVLFDARERYRPIERGPDKRRTNAPLKVRSHTGEIGRDDFSEDVRLGYVPAVEKSQDRCRSGGTAGGIQGLFHDLCVSQVFPGLDGEATGGGWVAKMNLS